MSFQKTIEQIMETYNKIIKGGGIQNIDVVDNIGELAEREYQELVKFIDPEKNKIKLSLINRTYLSLIQFACSKEYKKKKRALQRKLILKALDLYMNKIENKCNEAKMKSNSAEVTYDKHLQRVTECRINTLEWAYFAEQFTQALGEGSDELNSQKKNLRASLAENNVERAKVLRGEIINLDRSLRCVEKERNTCAIQSVSAYREFTFARVCYIKSKIYFQLLRKQSMVLEQLTNYLQTRFNEYKSAGNLFEVAEYLELKQELEKTCESLDSHFQESFPQLHKIEEEFQKIKETVDVGSMLSSVKDSDVNLYEYAVKIKENVLNSPL